MSKCVRTQMEKSIISTLSKAVSLVLFCYTYPALAGDLEVLFGGMGKCNLDNVVVVSSYSTQKSKEEAAKATNYIQNLQKANEVAGVARFAVQDSYFGLKAIYIDLPVVSPRDDNQVWRIYFDEKFSDVRMRLRKHLGVSFPSSPGPTKQYLAGNRPALMFDKKTEKPFIACRKTELGD
jgi:hypothetical protein